MPDSPPKLWIDSTQPDSIAGISVGCGLSTQCLAILPLQPELLAVGRQQQFDCGGVEPDAVIERDHLVAFVHARGWRSSP